MQEINICLSLEDANKVLMGLSFLQLRDSLTLFQRIQKECEVQIEAANAKAATNAAAGDVDIPFAT